MLSVDTLRDHLAAAFCCPEAEIAAYLDALQSRGALPAGDAVLGAGDIVVTLLAFLSGAPPAGGRG
jgi:hypothetical protein